MGVIEPFHSLSPPSSFLLSFPLDSISLPCMSLWGSNPPTCLPISPLLTPDYDPGAVWDSLPLDCDVSVQFPSLGDSSIPPPRVFSGVLACTFPSVCIVLLQLCADGYVDTAPLLFYPAKSPATLTCSWILKTPRKTQKHTRKACLMDHGLSEVLLPSLTVIHLGQPLIPHVTNAEKDACFLPTLKLSCGEELCQVHLTSSAPENFWKMITGYFKKKRTKKKSTCICASWNSALLLGSL